MKKIVIAGGSGFLGRTLAKHWHGGALDVVILSRVGDETLHGARQVPWNGKTLGAWATEIDGADVLINLAGRSVNCRYNAKNRREMIDSRVESTRVLGKAIRQCDSPPRVWINSSTATIYKHRFDAPNDEATGIIGATPEANDALSIKIAEAWEEAFDDALRTCDQPKTRGIKIRTAMVFGEEPGGVYHALARLVRLGLGGKMGDGKQWVSWLHAEDFCRAIDWLVEDDSSRFGIYNLCAPAPLSNADMMAKLRDSHGRAFGLPATRWMLEIGALFMRTETELILKSRRVVPSRLLNEGFTFRFDEFKKTAEDLARS